MSCSHCFSKYTRCKRVDYKNCPQYRRLLDSLRKAGPGQIVEIDSNTPVPSASSTGPDHYRSTGIEPWDAMEAWLSREEFIGFLRGNVLKYQARAQHKGQREEDLKKAAHYSRKLEEVLTKGVTLASKVGPEWCVVVCDKCNHKQSALLDSSKGRLVQVKCDDCEHPEMRVQSNANS